MLNGVFVVIGTIIGAGFASGKEIFTFFNVYGFYGFIGLLLSAFIIGFTIYKALSIIITYNIKSYSNFISLTVSKSRFINSVIYNITNIFLLVSFIVMVAGFSAYFSQELNLPSLVGSFIIVLLCFLTFLNNIKSIIKINTFFIPFLIFIILLLGIRNLESFQTIYSAPSSFSFTWLLSAVLYASYNLVIVFPILISLKDIVKTVKNAKLISCISTFFLIFIAIIIFCLLNFYFENIKDMELPIVYIASSFGVLFKFVCGVVILGAIFTTAISSGYGFLSNLNIKSRSHYILLSLLMCLSSVFLSTLGFSTLLNFLYPALGVFRFYTNSFSYSV